MDTGDLCPVVEQHRMARVAAAALAAREDGERAEDVAEGPLADGGAQEGDGLGDGDSHFLHEIMVPASRPGWRAR